MLADFQQALADLTASPGFARAARAHPDILLDTYCLSTLEFERLIGIVRHLGMSCACTVYRANRLAPLALNIPRTCKALGPHLKDLVDEYWERFPEGNVHFFVEAERFCMFVRDKLADGRNYGGAVDQAISEEHAAVSHALMESRFERS